MIPLLFSVSYAGYWGQAQLSLLEFVRHAGKLGFPSVMIAGKRPHLSPLDATPEVLESLRRALDPAKVRCLRDGGFDGIAVYEMCSPVRGGGAAENLDSCAAAYLRWMKESRLLH